MNRHIFAVVVAAAIFPHILSVAQTSRADSLLRIADSLRLAYDFRTSVDYYRQAIEAEQDTTRIPWMEDKRLMGENGASMMDFVYKPVVVAKHRFSTETFYLYYPLPDKAWRRVPNVLDSLGQHPYAKAVYFPDGAEEIYFSSQDEGGVRNVLMTEFRDTIWSDPAPLGEDLMSSMDEVYPIISDDGMTLWFASAGLHGMGGYDLYVSEWNARSKSWGTPTNMGLPYSSPYDDLLLCRSIDGKYTVFASNRDCPADSVDVYVLEHDSMPITSRVETAEELREIMKLEPAASIGSGSARSDVPENEDTKRYVAKMAEVRALRDSIYNCAVKIDELRSKYNTSDDVDERSRLTDELLTLELRAPQLKSSLDKAAAELQNIEMEFLFNGVVIDPDKVTNDADREIVSEDINYRFLKMDYGPAPDIKIDLSNRFDYTLMVLPEGRFAPDNTLPRGVVYQIQIFSITRKARVSELNGLSPVFERVSSGRYTYSAGLFRTYKDVLSQLNKVKARGFKGAFVVAFLDGKSISVETARTLE